MLALGELAVMTGLPSLFAVECEPAEADRVEAAAVFVDE
jgi:hypothetical protein